MSLQLPQRLTMDEAAAALHSVRVAAASGGRLDVDAHELQEFDSAALALLLEAKRMAQGAGQAFAVHGAPLKLQQLAQLYGVAELLGVQAGTAGGG